MQPAEQEEEDFNRIKEESRRRREAILEKYKKQQQQVGQTHENEEKGTFKIHFSCVFPLIIFCFWVQFLVRGILILP